MAEEKYATALTKVSNIYFPMIQSQLENNNIEMSKYAKQCVMNTITAINNVLDEKGITWQDPQLDKSNITEVLLSIASLQLNPAANPREVYFQLRNQKVKKGGKDAWQKKIEMGIEGDGNDAILSRFGRNVKRVAKFWEVREGDGFKYPRYVGLQMQSPEWEPTGQGKVIRIVYPIITVDDMVEYHIAEREDVIKNLIAHINNNLMNETFGIAKNRYEATYDQKKKINAKKKEILNIAKEKGVDAALDAPELEDYISPAWKDPQSRESMIIRKMRNNIVKKIPKNFESSMREMAYEDQSNDYQRIRKEIDENANTEYFDMEPEPIENHQTEPEEEAQNDSEYKDPKTDENTKEPAENEPKQAKDFKGNQSEDIFDLDDITNDEVPF